MKGKNLGSLDKFWLFFITSWIGWNSLLILFDVEGSEMVSKSLLGYLPNLMSIKEITRKEGKIVGKISFWWGCKFGI